MLSLLGVDTVNFSAGQTLTDCLDLDLSQGTHCQIALRKDVVLGSKHVLSPDLPKLQACPLRAETCWEKAQSSSLDAEITSRRRLHRNLGREGNTLQQYYLKLARGPPPPVTGLRLHFRRELVGIF